MELIQIKTDKAPIPNGAYSQGVRMGNIVYVSGQLPISPDKDKPLDNNLETQIHQTFKNVESILDAAGSGLNKVIKMTIYISDIKNWDLVDEIYQQYITSEILPSRSIVPTRELHYGLPIEIDAIAYVEGS